MLIAHIHPQQLGQEALIEINGISLKSALTGTWPGLTGLMCRNDSD